MRTKLVLASALALCIAAGAALACQHNSNPALDENFKNADPGWGQPDNVAAFTPNGLTLTPPVSGSAWRWNANYTMDRADLCVEVVSPTSLPTPADEDAVGAVGVWFWGADSQNFYTATITLDGKAAVDRLIAGQWAPVIAPAPSAAVKTAPGETNEIEIVTNGNAASFYVNGVKVADFRRDSTASGRQTPQNKPGVYGESGPKGTTWVFSRVRVF